MGRKRKTAGARAGKNAGRKASSAGENSSGTGPGTGAEEAARGVEPVAPATLSVEVDAAQLSAEADALAAGAPETNSSTQSAVEGDPAPAIDAGAGEPSARANEVAPAMRVAVAQLCGMIAPNWKITREESDNVGNSLAQVLVYWMPAGIVEPKYVALGSLALSLWSVAAARRDPDTGEFMPLRAAPVAVDAPARAPAPSLQL